MQNQSGIVRSNPWIIGSGATNHMTGLQTLFTSYSTCSGRDQVKIANGSVSSISGKGFVPLSSSISLS